jgi:hypothetical protein
MGIGVQEVPELIMTSAEAGCRAHRTEATHRTISALDTSMILLNALVEILAVPVTLPLGWRIAPVRAGTAF